MPLVMNASSKEQTVQVHGAWFTFAPNQIKEMNENKVFFLATNKAYMGFVSVPDELADISFRQSKEGQEMEAKARMQGIASRVKHLEQVRDNELIGLKRDLEQKNIQADVRAFLSEGCIAAMEELVSYKTRKADDTAKKIERVKELEAALEGDELDLEA
jgi:ABC-type sulfate transport system substrate-binding protein